MQWISATQLGTWAATNSAKVDLPLLVCDLILASSPDVSAIRFPSSNKGQVRGLDGVLVAQVAGLNVPLGESIWEIGTEADYRAKGLRDFTKRSEPLDVETRRKTTFVFVTPRTWNVSTESIEDWVAARLAEYEWKDLRVIDGSALETWLAASPATAAKHARFTLKVSPPSGALSTDEFWDQFSGQFERPLSEALLLADREASVKALIETLQGPPSQLTLQGDSSDEVTAFAVAAIRSAEPQTRAFLEARTIIVESSDAGRQLIEASSLNYVLQSSVAFSPAPYAQRAPTLVPIGRSQRNGSAQPLARPSAHAFAQGLIAMGYDEQESASLARGSGKSLAALRRLKPGGAYARPAWLSAGVELLPAILCGGWENANLKDQAVLEALDGKRTYDEIMQAYRALLPDEDAPLDHAAGTWLVRAPMDAFIEAGHLIGDEHLSRFNTVVREVFSELAPEPDPNDKVGIPRSGGDPRHSDLLRDGLATTLLLLAVWQDPAGLPIAKGEGQRIADELVRSLPGLANDERVIRSFENQLPILAEAAPVPLLEALERALEGEAEAMSSLLADKQTFFGPRSAHVSLLWALETLAWDPQHLSRAALGLARLAELDDETNRSGNRPISSLKEIFLPWHPSTNASVAERLAVLESLARRTPDVAWRLIMALLPSPHGVSTSTMRPKLREAGASGRQTVTYRSLWDLHTTLVERAVALAGAQPDRWRDLVKAIGHLAPNDRALIVDRLPSILEGLGGEDRQVIWSELRDLVADHIAFADAQWAMPTDQLAPLSDLVERFKPSDPMVELRRLFDDWPRGREVADVELERRQSLGTLIASRGLSGALDLATTIRSPYLVAEALKGLDIDLTEIKTLLLDALTRGEAGQTFAINLSALIRSELDEETAATWLRDMASAQDWSPETIASLLLAWPNTAATWALADQAGPVAADSYWHRRNGFRIDGPREDLLMAVGRYLAVGRASTALQVALDRLDELPAETLLEVIRSIVAELNSDTTADSTMLGYYLEKAFENLDTRESLSPEDIAVAEFAVLPLIERSNRKLKLNTMLARSPEAYHHFLRLVFKGESETTPSAPDAAAQSQWRSAYSVITQFHDVPGVRDGQAMDADLLRAWVTRTRALGAEHDRVAITDIYVGHLLAHAPLDPADGAWPDVAVRSLIEDLKSEDVERGVQTERFNMRGVHTRGLLDGGEQERDLSRLYRTWATAAAGSPRTAALLENIAKGWDQDAARQDDRSDTLRLRT